MYLFNTHREEGFVRVGVSGLEEYSSVMNELDQIKKTSVDYYAAIRSMYHQKRNAEIRNGVEADLPPIPDLGYELAPEPTPRPAGEELGADPSAPAKGVPISSLDSLDGTAISLY